MILIGSKNTNGTDLVGLCRLFLPYIQNTKPLGVNGT